MEKLFRFTDRIYKSIIALLIIFFLSIVAYYYLYMYYDEGLSRRITSDVIMINDLFASMYLIKTDNGYIAIDAGFDENIIKRGLAYNGIKPEDITVLFLTHTDTDHQGAINLFKNATIYIPRKEIQMLNSHTPRFASFQFYYNELKTEKYEMISGGDEIKIGKRCISCIELPGHTYGSMGFIIDGKYLFSGDAFRLKNGKLSVPFKKYFAMNINVMKKTLRHTSELKEIKYIFTSHSGFSADFNFAVSGQEK